MNNLQRLAAMGCGSGILNSVIDRSNIAAAIGNAKTFLKYYKYAVKSNLYSKEAAVNGIYPYYTKLKEVEHLANTYRNLWQEKYCKILLEMERFIGNENICH